jgi:hypothetical protein
MHTIVTDVHTDANSCCMPCSQARGNITCMPFVNSCPNGHLTDKQTWAAKTQFYYAPLSQCTQMMYLCFHVAEMAQVQHGTYMCRGLCTCQFLPVFKFTPCGPVDQRPLHFSHQTAYHQKACENFFPMMTTKRHLLAIVAVWVLHE